MTMEVEYTPLLVPADGVTTDYDCEFVVQTAADLAVALVLQADETDVTGQTLGVDYTVSINASTGKPTISFLTPPAGTYNVSGRRVVDIAQTVNIPAGGLFREQQIENALDRIVMMIQQVEEAVSRAFLISEYITDDVPTLDTIAAADDYAQAAEDARDEAQLAQAAAEAAAAGVNLPSIDSGDAGKLIVVNAGGTAYEISGLPVLTTGNQTVGGNKTFSGLVTLPAGTPAIYDGTPTIDDDKHLTTKKYTDDAIATAVKEFGAYETTDASQVGGTGATLIENLQYQASVDGFVCVFAIVPSGTSSVNTVTGEVGTVSGSRTAFIGNMVQDAVNNKIVGLTMPVAKNEYWFVDIDNDATTRRISFKPLS